jgi:hypothetical protein
MQITKIIVEEAKRRGLECNSVKDLVKLWRSVDSDRICEIIWHCCYGAFDLMPHWSSDMEDEYMKMKEWVYAPPSSESKKQRACWQQVFTHVKNDLVKQINRAVLKANRGHGRQVRVKRDKDDIDDTNHSWRRRKGVFEKWMVTGKASKKTKGNTPSPKKKEGVRSSPRASASKRKEKNTMESRCAFSKAIEEHMSDISVDLEESDSWSIGFGKKQSPSSSTETERSPDNMKTVMDLKVSFCV